MSTLEDRLTVQIKRTSERDELISQGAEQGLMLKELGASINLNRESARLYLIQLGLYEAWREKRKQQKQEQKEKQEKERQALQRDLETKAQVLSLLKEQLYQKLEQENWAMQKAVKAVYARDRLIDSKFTLGNILPIFQKYEQAQKQGEKLSLEKLAKRTVFRFDEVGKLLREIGVEPMHGARERQAVPKEKIEAVTRAYKKISMRAADVAYFLDVPYYVVRDRFKSEEKQQSLPLCIKNFGPDKITYRLASQIYEAHNLGFSKGEIIELLDTTPRAVRYALKERKALGSKITNALQVLYPEERITKPYINYSR